MLVLNTTSPRAIPCAPAAVPRYTVPFSRARTAFMRSIFSPRTRLRASARPHRRAPSSSTVRSHPVRCAPLWILQAGQEWRSASTRRGRSLTNTRAPAGRDCTLSPPGPVFSGRSVSVIDDVGRCGVSCSVRSSAAYPSRATRMVYDPSARSRSATGVFPRGFPFTSTSASAGVDRINMLPVGARSTAPDAGRDGVGAGARAAGATGAGFGRR